MKVAEVGKYDTIRRTNIFFTQRPETETPYSDPESAVYQKAEHYHLTDFP
jgi:hypothetical protein